MNFGALRRRYLAAMGLPTLLATTGCPARHVGAEEDASAKASSVDSLTGIPTGAAGAGTRLVDVDGSDRPASLAVPEPDAPWPSVNHPYGCITESLGVVPAPLLPEPFARCQDTLREDMSSVTRLSPQATLARRRTNPTACCYVTFTRIHSNLGGRPLTTEQGPVVAAPLAREDWRARLMALDTSDLSAHERAARAASWLEQAAAEHASVASFSRFSLQLAAVGAPPELLIGAHRAAIDEIDHAERCYALAAAFAGDGDTIGPGPLDLSKVTFATPTLAALAMETFLDGCVSETLAAVMARERCATEPSPVVRGVLGTIAEDEERHAELAWRTIAWALATGGEEVAVGLRTALDQVKSTSEGGDPRAMTTLREVVIPCAEALLGI